MFDSVPEIYQAILELTTKVLESFPLCLLDSHVIGNVERRR